MRTLASTLGAAGLALLLATTPAEAQGVTRGDETAGETVFAAPVFFMGWRF